MGRKEGGACVVVCSDDWGERSRSQPASGSDYRRCAAGTEEA